MFEDKNMERISMTLPRGLMLELDKVLDEIGYPNRSEAIRDALREFINKHAIKDPDHYMDGFLIISFNHNKRGLLDELTDIEHHSNVQIYSTMHVHVGPDNCSEAIAVKGRVSEINEFKKRVQTIKGMLLCELVPLYVYENADAMDHHHHHHGDERKENNDEG